MCVKRACFLSMASYVPIKKTLRILIGFVHPQPQKEIGARPISPADVLTTYHKTSNISHTLVGNKIVDHSDVVGASPVGAAPTTSSFST